MQKKHIITISGKPGSGKSSTADKVAELLGYTRHSSGETVRKLLKEQHITLEAYNRMAANEHDLDEKIDAELRSLRDENDIVVDSRLGFYWIPDSFKVYLDLDIEVATARIFRDIQTNATRDNEGGDHTFESVTQSVKERMENERKRFMSLYEVDPYNKDNFDYIINTSHHTPQSVALVVSEVYKNWLQSDS